MRDVVTTEQALRRRLDRVAARRQRRGLPAPQVLVRTPEWELEYGARSQPFHAASVGKVMTATLIAQLVDEGHFRFGTPMVELLPAADVRHLPTVPGRDSRPEITVDHLLAHTSGLPDYFQPHRGHTTAAGVDSIATAPERVWTPGDLLAEVRGLPVVGAPGERFHYTDTAYVVLGRIAEAVTGQRLADLLRQRIFAPAGMTQSSTPYDAAEQPADMREIDVAPFWIGEHELRRSRGVSLDWAGGGVVGTVDDLVRFQEAFHGGALVSAESAAHLTRPRNRLRPGIHYGAGTATLRFAGFSPLLRALPEPVGGLGFFATQMFFYPTHQAHVVLNFHSDREMRRSLMTHIRIAQQIAGRRTGPR